MKSSCIISLSLLACLFVGCESGNVKKVKKGSVGACSSKSIEEMVNGYLENVQWRDGESASGNEMVIVNGDAQYLGKKSKIELQFAFSKDGSTFLQSYTTVDGQEVEFDQTRHILGRMCRTDLASLAERVADVKARMEQMRKSGTEISADDIALDKEIDKSIADLPESDSELLWEIFEDDPRLETLMITKKVRDASFFEYPETTIGKAFNTTFGDPVWEVVATNNGSHVVQMNGVIDEKGLMYFAGHFSFSYFCDVWNARYPEQAPFCDNYPSDIDQMSDKMRGTSLYKHWVGYMMKAANGDEAKRYDSEKWAKVFAAFAPPGSRIYVQFKLSVELLMVELGYFGIVQEDGTRIDINKVVSRENFLKYVYADNKYKPSTYVKGEDQFFDKLYTVDTLVDARDKQKYKVVSYLNGQTWLAENLKYKTKNSKCYEDDSKNCQKLGRLYNWNDAMAACPEGYRLPAYEDWKKLESFTKANAIKYSKNRTYVEYTGQLSLYSSEWNDGSDMYEFSLIPAGAFGGDDIYDEGEEYEGIGEIAYFWNSSEEKGFGTDEYTRASRKQFGTKYRNNVNDYAGVPKNALLSVRCIKN